MYHAKPLEDTFVIQKEIAKSLKKLKLLINLFKSEGWKEDLGDLLAKEVSSITFNYINYTRKAHPEVIEDSQIAEILDDIFNQVTDIVYDRSIKHEMKIDCLLYRLGALDEEDIEEYLDEEIPCMKLEEFINLISHMINRYKLRFFKKHADKFSTFGRMKAALFLVDILLSAIHGYLDNEETDNKNLFTSLLKDYETALRELLVNPVNFYPKEIVATFINTFIDFIYLLKRFKKKERLEILSSQIFLFKELIHQIIMHGEVEPEVFPFDQFLPALRDFINLISGKKKRARLISEFIREVERFGMHLYDFRNFKPVVDSSLYVKRLDRDHIVFEKIPFGIFEYLITEPGNFGIPSKTIGQLKIRGKKKEIFCCLYKQYSYEKEDTDNVFFIVPYKAIKGLKKEEIRIIINTTSGFFFELPVTEIYIPYKLPLSDSVIEKVLGKRIKSEFKHLVGSLAILEVTTPKQTIVPEGHGCIFGPGFDFYGEPDKLFICEWKEKETKRKAKTIELDVNDLIEMLNAQFRVSRAPENRIKVPEEQFEVLEEEVIYRLKGDFSSYPLGAPLVNGMGGIEGICLGNGIIHSVSAALKLFDAGILFTVNA